MRGVRRGKPAVNVLHERASRAPGMSCDRPAAILQHPSNFHELTEPACEGCVRLADIEAVSLRKDTPFVCRCKTLAARDRNLALPGEFGVTPRIGVRQRLFEKEQIVRL